MTLNREILQEYTKLRQKYKFTDKENNSFIELIMQVGDQEKQLSIYGVSNSVICCPQCGNERLENTGGDWYICCDKDCDWGDKL